MVALDRNNPELDFVRRTREQVEAYKSKNEFTNLLNCMLGLIIVPREKMLMAIPDDPTSTVDWQNAPPTIAWGKCSSCKRPMPQTVKTLVVKLRNAAAHCQLDFTTDDTVAPSKWKEVIFKDGRDKDFKAVFTFEQLKCSRSTCVTGSFRESYEMFGVYGGSRLASGSSCAHSPACGGVLFWPTIVRSRHAPILGVPPPSSLSNTILAKSNSASQRRHFRMPALPRQIATLPIPIPTLPVRIGGGTGFRQGSRGREAVSRGGGLSGTSRHHAALEGRCRRVGVS